MTQIGSLIDNHLPEWFRFLLFIFLTFIAFTVCVFVAVAVAMLVIPQCHTTCDATSVCNTSTSVDNVPQITLSRTNTPGTTKTTVTTSTHANVNLTSRQLFHRQQQRFNTVPKCRPTYLAVRLDEELDRMDRLLDEELLPPQVPIKRCPYSCGLCPYGGRCQPRATANVPVMVRYKDGGGGGGWRYTHRDLQEHLECLCQ